MRLAKAPRVAWAPQPWRLRAPSQNQSGREDSRPIDSAGRSTILAAAEAAAQPDQQRNHEDSIAEFSTTPAFTEAGINGAAAG